MTNYIQALQPHHAPQAQEIDRVMKAAYAIEQAWLKVDDFPPMRRTAADIMQAKSLFWGLMAYDQLCAVIECELRETRGHLHIASLVTHPRHFQKGYASELLREVLTQPSLKKVTVTTVIGNEPAIRLYQKHGFVIRDQWETHDGFLRVELDRIVNN